MKMDILRSLYFQETGTGGGCTALVQGQDEKDCAEYIMITDSDVEACAPVETTTHFSACKYSNETSEATSVCAMGLTFRQLLDWLRENPTDTLTTVDEIVIEVATAAATNAAALIIQTALGQDDGGIAGVFFSGSGSNPIRDHLYKYLDCERSHEDIGAA